MKLSGKGVRGVLFQAQDLTTKLQHLIHEVGLALPAPIDIHDLIECVADHPQGMAAIGTMSRREVLGDDKQLWSGIPFLYKGGDELILTIISTLYVSEQGDRKIPVLVTPLRYGGADYREACHVLDSRRVTIFPLHPVR